MDRSKAGAALTQFMDAVNHDVKTGQHLIIRTVGNTIWVTSPAIGTKRIKGNHTFVTALWQVYFGNPCYQTSLRDGLLSGLERLHKLAPAE